MNCSGKVAGYWLLVVRSNCLGWPSQQAGDAQVFIDVGPVDAFAFTEEFEILALIRCGVQKSRKPGQRNRNLAAVRERYG
jgi:hypothetical protein